ncbi:MAG: anti-sigma factor, partial [Ardenticatenaceae bacterium]|nr:anti-sigma factor [Ardenticatenaceae bacterium]
TVLGEALLQMIGLNAAEAQRLAQNIDWTSTLLLPIPQDFASFNEVTVEGVSGLALNSVNGEGSALFWQKDGVVYLLLGPGLMADDLVSLAGTLE